MEFEHMTPDEIQARTPLAARERSQRRRITTYVVVCILNVALLVLLCTLMLTPARHQSQSGVHVNNTSRLGDIDSPLIGKPAPAFTLPILNESLGSAKINLADFKGRPVILNFWASWCTPCNDEAPLLQKSWPSLKAQGIVVIGIDGAERSSDALKFMRTYAISYPNVQDSANSATAADYGVTGLPITIFIDHNGVVSAKWASPLNEQGLQLETAKLVH